MCTGRKKCYNPLNNIYVVETLFYRKLSCIYLYQLDYFVTICAFSSPQAYFGIGAR
jgi:hypothetical protein